LFKSIKRKISGPKIRGLRSSYYDNPSERRKIQTAIEEPLLSAWRNLEMENDALVRDLVLLAYGAVEA
jgi:hypothetical protein